MIMVRTKLQLIAGAFLVLASCNTQPTGPATNHGLPGAPTGVTGLPGNGHVTVSWTAPTDRGASAITQYLVTSSPGGATCATTEGTSTQCVVSNLVNGTAYAFTVVAVNKIGPGSPSAVSESVVPFTVPGPPANVIGVAATGEVSLSWAAPDSDGGSAITGYLAFAVGDLKNNCVATPAKRRCVIMDLTGGTSYTFSVVALNSAGNGKASPPSALVAVQDVPETPRSVVAVPGQEQASVSWTAPTSDGGSVITGYKAFAMEDTSKHCTSTAPERQCVITGLKGGTPYRFRVKASNDLGTSDPSLPSSTIVPTAVPVVPTPTQGLSWTVLPGNFPAFKGGAFAYGRGRYVAFTDSASSTLNGMLTSVNAVDWVPAQGELDYFQINAVIWTGSEFVAAGGYTGFIYNYGPIPYSTSATLTSSDGLVWTQRSYTPPSMVIPLPLYTSVASWGGSIATAGPGCVVWSGSAFVTVNVGPNGPYTAGNGNGWGESTPGEPIRACAATNSGRIVTLIGKKIMTANGSGWEETYSSAATLRSITSTGTDFVAVGDSGAVVVSTDGLHWYPQVSGTTKNLNAVFWTQFKLVALGENVVLTSP